MNLEDLGRRAVACKHWRWMEGMLAGTTRIVDVKDGPYVFDSEYEDCAGLPHKAVPDLSDPATLGCLLHLVQEAWNACRISVCFSAYTPDATKRWSVPISYFKEQRDLVHVPSFYGTTQAEALVAALEAAP
jgi:hypothetical protein